MRRFLSSVLLSSSLLLASCAGEVAETKMHIDGMSGGSVEVKILDAAGERFMDSVRCNASGDLKFKVDFDETPDPGFVSVYRNGRRLAYLILEKGDKVSVSTDTVGYYGGAYSVEGSENSRKLYESDKRFYGLLGRYAGLNMKLSEAEVSGSETEVKELKTALGRCYVDAKREALGEVMENLNSISSVPLIYRHLDEGLPLFGMNSDGIVIRRLYDSLSVRYPENPFVKGLLDESEVRMNALMMADRLENAETIGFPEIVLPDVHSEKIALSSLKGRNVLLVFSAMSDAQLKMFNHDLMDIYQEFKNRNFEIYQVSLDRDKTLWASTVKSQKLPWINVCDGLGTASPAVSAYNVNGLPSLFLIGSDGTLSGRVSQSALKSELKKLLK